MIKKILKIKILKIKGLIGHSLIWSYSISFLVTVFFFFDKIKALSFSKIWYHYGYCFNYYVKHPELSIALLKTKIVDVKYPVPAFVQNDKI
jgi:hypothetical protein